MIGALAGGGTVSQSFAMSKVASAGAPVFPDYAFNRGFTNLLSVKFSSSGSEIDIYNGFAITISMLAA